MTRSPAAMSVMYARLTKAEALTLAHAVCYDRVMVEARQVGGLEAKGFARRLNEKELAEVFRGPPMLGSVVLIPTALGRRRVLGAGRSR